MRRKKIRYLGAFNALNLDWRYLTLEVSPENLKRAVKGARAFGFKGFNCTIPHKIEVIQYLDSLGESAELMGAVNCVVNKNGKLIAAFEMNDLESQGHVKFDILGIELLSKIMDIIGVEV